MTVFFDSNVLLYTLAAGDPRQAVALRCLDDGGIINLQVLNEFANVARRKLGMSWETIEAALQSFRTILPHANPLTLGLHQAGLKFAGRYGFAFYDALIVAAAIDAHCDTLLSEDMQDGIRIEDRLTIRNPFRQI